MNARTPGVFVLVGLLSACGAASPVVETGEVEAPCTASCGPTPVRDVRAVVVGEATIVVARGLDGALLAGGAALGDEEDWEAATFSLSAMGSVSGRPLALATDGRDALLVVSDEAGVRVVSLDASGHAELLLTVADGPAERASVARDAAGRLWCAWLPAGEGERAVQVTRLDGEQQVGVATGLPAVIGSVFALVPLGDAMALAVGASTGGVMIARLGLETPLPPLDVSSGPADALAAASVGDRLVLAWAGRNVVRTVALEGGTLSPPLVVDDGSRTAEPLHDIGAGLVVALRQDQVALIAYQDQTRGTLVTARVHDGMAPRQEHADAAWTRAMDIAIVPTPTRFHVLDVAAGGTTTLETHLEVTTLR